MTRTPQYHAGYLRGKRAGQNGDSPDRVCDRSRDFQHGYSDGYHKGTGGIIF